MILINRITVAAIVYRSGYVESSPNTSSTSEKSLFLTVRARKVLVLVFHILLRRDGKGLAHKHITLRLDTITFTGGDEIWIFEPQRRSISAKLEVLY